MPDLSVQHVTIAGVVILVFSILGVLSAIQAVLTARTSQGAIAWAVTLITWPLLAVPAYWVLGRNRFRGYVDARRDRIDDAFKFLEQVGPNFDTYTVDLGNRFGEARALEQLARMRFMRGNDTALYIDGKQTFAAIFAAIDQASDYVLAEFFIVNDDNLGRQFQQLLIRKAAEGIDCYLLYDDVGSSRITKSYIQQLVDAGVRVTGMKTTSGGWQNRFQLNFRNHRKIVVVDGHVAFIGGHNVGDEYLGEHQKLTPWRDTHMSITGPSAMAAQLTFIEDWHWATTEVPEVCWQPKAAADADKTVFMLPSGPADEYETCGLFFTHAINSARHRVWIATPYFVPDEGIITALQLAALRGVDVKILIPGLPDKPMIKMAAMAYVHPVTESGAKMYEYGDGFMHQKVMIVDDHLATIGTANFDNRSFRLNFEISVLTIDEEFIAEVKEMLECDFEKSSWIDPESVASRPWTSRLGTQVARLFAPVL